MENENYVTDIKRRVTDKYFLVFLIIYISSFMVACLFIGFEGDFSRGIDGYDNCGNVCGRRNKKLPNISCSGADMTDKKILAVYERGLFLVYMGHRADNNLRKCVPYCNIPGFIRIANQCVKKDIALPFLQDCMRNVILCGIEFYAFLMAVCIVMSVIMLLIFRVGVDHITHGVFLVSGVLSTTISISMWAIWSCKRKLKRGVIIILFTFIPIDLVLYASIGFTIFTISHVVAVFVFRKHFDFVLLIFKEAKKVGDKIPFIMLVPFVTTVIRLTIVSLTFISNVFMSSLGELKYSEEYNFYYYKQDINMKMKMRWVYDIFGFLWFWAFIRIFEEMCIIGAVGQWFFSRNKSKLHFPLAKSIRIVSVYHLGSVAFAAFVIGTLRYIKTWLFMLFVKSFHRTITGGKCCFSRVLKCACGYILKFVRYLTRNVYIEIVLNGLGFCSAGKRLFKIQEPDTIRQMLVISTVVDVILFLSKIIIIASTMVIGMIAINTKDNITSRTCPAGIILIISIDIATCFIHVAEVIVDTIFICVYEDYYRNDGKKPYFMSKELMVLFNTETATRM